MANKRKYTKRKTNQTKEIFAPFSSTLFGHKDEWEKKARRIHNMLKRGSVSRKERVWAANHFLRMFQIHNEQSLLLRDANTRTELLKDLVRETLNDAS